jgi:hypothetical protein
MLKIKWTGRITNDEVFHLDRKEVLVMEHKVPANDSEPFESSPTMCVW